MSTQLIGQGVVEIVAEASGLRATIAEAVAEASRGGAAIGKGISEGAAKASDGIELLDGKTNRYIRSIERQIAATSLSAAGQRAFEAQSKGISSDVAGPYLAQLDSAIRKKEAEAEAVKASARAKADEARVEAELASASARAASARESFLQSLREQVALTGKSTEETLRYRAAQLGMGSAAAPLILQLENVKAANKLAAEAARELSDAQAKALRNRNDADAFVSGLERQANAIGKSRSELLTLEAAQRGVSAQAAPYIAKLRDQEQALQRVAAGNNLAGLSQKQYNASLRGVPAQITDIVVSLQGGQAPLTVLLQQGGQLKDMFGGVVPAVRALSSELVKLATNPYVLLLGAVAAVAGAYYSGSKEQSDYVKGLALTGNQAGVTAGQLQVAARAMGEVSSTQGAAAEALNAIVESGGVRGLTDLTRYAETARDAQKYLGLEVKETAKAYSDLAKDPVKASERLTESMGYLTHAQYQQITALVEAGDKTKAAEVAQRAYDDAVRAAATSVQANLGLIERGWNAITGATKEAIDWAKRVGRPDTGADTMANMERTLGLARNQERLTGDPTERLKIEAAIRAEGLRQMREVDTAMAQAERTRTEQEKIAAEQRVKTLDDATRSRAQIRAKEIGDMRRDYALLGRTEEQMRAAEKAINEKYKDKAVRAPKAYTEDSGSRAMTQLKEAEAALRAQLQAEQKLTDAQRERAKFEAEIAEIKTKKVLTADQKSLLADESRLRAQHDINVGVAEEVRLKGEREKADAAALAAAENYRLAIERINITLDSAESSRAEQLAGLTTTEGRGDKAGSRADEERRLMREYERQKANARKAAATTGQSPDGDLATISQRQTDAVAKLREYYATEDQLRGNWETGFTRTFENYYDSAKDVAGRVSDALTRGLTAVEDAFVSLATTGKVSFSGLVNSMIADLIRFQVRAALSSAAGSNGGIFSALIQGAIGYFTGGAGGSFASSGINPGGEVGYGVYSSGGYTGPGGKYTERGTVHAGEIVFSQEDVREHGGVSAVERMRKSRRGYSSGGPVGGAPSAMAGGAFGNVTIQNFGADVQTEKKSNGKGGFDLVVIVKQLEDMMGRNLSQGVGSLARGGEARYGWKA